MKKHSKSKNVCIYNLLLRICDQFQLINYELSSYLSSVVVEVVSASAALFSGRTEKRHDIQLPQWDKQKLQQGSL
jgi:hypothetical protein